VSRKKQILRERGAEVATAGRMFLEALVTKTPGRFFSDKGARLARELAERQLVLPDAEVIDAKKPQ
jgi:hypothetical protein